jgi:hypothetical protein
MTWKTKNHKIIRIIRWKTINTWEEKGIVLETTPDDCKRLWKNLRDRFTKEKRTQTGEAAKESSSHKMKRWLISLLQKLDFYGLNPVSRAWDISGEWRKPRVFWFATTM